MTEHSSAPGAAPALPEPEKASDPDGPTATPRLAAGLVVVVAVVAIVAAYLMRDTPVRTSHYVLLSLLLFTVGAFGVLIRRNALVLFMCIELMLNAVNVAFVAFARMHGDVNGHAIVLFVMIVAAAEVAVGLAIIVAIFRRRLSANVDDLNLLRW